MDGKEITVRTRIGHVSLICLKIIAAAGVISVAIALPGVASALRLSPQSKEYKKKLWNIQNVTIKRLHKQGLIFISETKQGPRARLTDKGKQELEKRGHTCFAPPKRKWDGKWRVVIFDIPEENGHKRDMLRINLQRCNFVKIQNSVWVYPYTCERLIALLRANFDFKKEVLLMEVDAIENSSWLKKHFKL